MYHTCYWRLFDTLEVGTFVLARNKNRSGTVNSNMVNSKFHLIRSYCEIFVYNCPNISCLKYTVNSNFHLIRSKTLPTNDFELTVPDLYIYYLIFKQLLVLPIMISRGGMGGGGNSKNKTKLELQIIESPS